MNVDIEKLVRENIRRLNPYSSARKEFAGKADVWLDANENTYGSPLPENFNRYPDPAQFQLKTKLAEINQVALNQIAVGNGSDELIDHIVRIFCIPGRDNVLVTPPTFRMYEVAAHINDIGVKQVLLNSQFQINSDMILKEVDGQTKIIFLCSPNNPTGNTLDRREIDKLINGFKGIVVIDEAYIHFSEQESFIHSIPENNNLIVLQTLSKAWGLAGLRVGIAYTNPVIAEYLNKIKMPYNLSAASQQWALQAMENSNEVLKQIREIRDQRRVVADALNQFDFIERIYPGAANFLLIRVKDASSLHAFLISKKIIVRNQSSQPLLQNCLRITIGTPDENIRLIEALKSF